MTSTEKIKAMLQNEKVDFVCACGWMHTPEADRRSPEEFAARIIQITDENNWDFVKIMNNGCYIPEAYGEELEFYEKNIPMKYKKIKKLASVITPLVKTEQDLLSLPVIDVASNPVFQRNIKAVKILADHYKGEVPVIPTIFLPGITLIDLCGGNDKCAELIETCPEKVEVAFEALIKTDMALADAYIEAGADGFFIATKHTSPSLIAPELFERFCAKYDKRFLAHIKDRTWFNILHVHGQTDMYMDKFADYDVQAINWENIPHGLIGKGVSSVADVRSMTDKILIGGTDQFFDFYGSVEEVRERFRVRLETAVREAKDNRFIFAPGCSLPLDISEENIHQLRVVADEYNEKLGH